ncbi:MAG: SH3 domain-containing protein [Desulfarculus sp.]|nr:SH3 domain-containing protein [Desulfarculus sp.]
MKRGKLSMAAALLFLAAGLAWAAGEAMSVQVREGQVRAQPSFLAAIVATLGYGERVQVSGEQGAWRQVSASQGATGWMHLSSLTPKQVVLQAGEGLKSGGASGEEMALAGKGFNKEVEADFAARNRGADFASVNRMEQSYRFSPPQVEAFVREGGLTPAPGGGR